MATDLQKHIPAHNSERVLATSAAATQAPLVRASLRTPRAAAIAGIVFSILLISSFSLLQLSVPEDQLEVGDWLKTSSGRIALALNLVPFAGSPSCGFLVYC